MTASTRAITDEHLELTESVTGQLRRPKALASARATADGGDAHPSEIWASAAGLGWHGLAVGETFDGSDFGLSDLAIVLEAMGRELCPGPFLPTVTVSSIPDRCADDVILAEAEATGVGIETAVEPRVCLGKDFAGAAQPRFTQWAGRLLERRSDIGSGLFNSVGMGDPVQEQIDDRVLDVGLRHTTLFVAEQPRREDRRRHHGAHHQPLSQRPAGSGFAHSGGAGPAAGVELVENGLERGPGLSKCLTRGGVLHRHDERGRGLSVLFERSVQIAHKGPSEMLFGSEVVRRERGPKRLNELLERFDNRSRENSCLRSEMGVERGLVCACAGGDLLRGRAGPATCGEQLAGGDHQLRADVGTGPSLHRHPASKSVVIS